MRHHYLRMRNCFCEVNFAKFANLRGGPKRNAPPLKTNLPCVTPIENVFWELLLIEKNHWSYVKHPEPQFIAQFLSSTFREIAWSGTLHTTGRPDQETRHNDVESVKNWKRKSWSLQEKKIQPNPFSIEGATLIWVTARFSENSSSGFYGSLWNKH